MITKATQSVSDTRDSLTGYDEVEVEKYFADDIQNLLEDRPIKAGRALAYIVILRGLREDDVKNPSGKAYARVMEMTVSELNEFFPDDPDDPGEDFDDEPVTPEGKDDSQPA